MGVGSYIWGHFSHTQPSSYAPARKRFELRLDKRLGKEMVSADGDRNELLSLLQRYEIDILWEERLKTCRELLRLIESQRVRDYVVDKFPRKIYPLVVDSIRLGWEKAGEECAQACWTGLVRLPEFEEAVAGDFLDEGFLEQLCGRFQAGAADERAFLRDTLHWVYATFPQKRIFLRQRIGAVLRYFVRAPSCNIHIAELLQVVRMIIKGFPSLNKVDANVARFVVRFPKY